MVQLDLNKLASITAINAGSGLLQVWMDPSIWGMGIETHCRVIPSAHPNTVDEWPKLPEQPEGRQWEKEDPDANWDIVYESRTEDPEYSRLTEAITYWRGATGFNWSLSSYSERDSINPPIYFADWKPSGLNIPSRSLIESLLELEYWENPGDHLLTTLTQIHEAYPENLETVFTRQSVALGRWPSEFELCQWAGKEDGDFGTEVIPLLCFDGPLSCADPVEDRHSILFKRLPSGEIRFQSKCFRWTF